MASWTNKAGRDYFPYSSVVTFFAGSSFFIDRHNVRIILDERAVFFNIGLTDKFLYLCSWNDGKLPSSSCFCVDKATALCAAIIRWHHELNEGILSVCFIQVQH